MLEIGKKIKELRLSKKLTQKDLAKILNVTPQAISKWERNESNPDIQML
ncbi:MAG: helix-turn-helix transcriptional regulator, partial [Carnobacterium sp.]